MARPTKSKDHLTHLFAFRLDDAESAVLMDKINRSNMKKSDFLRDCVLKNQTVVVAKPTASLEKKRMQFLFNKTSNNMNQIAHVLNGANAAGKLSAPLCREALADLEAIAKYLRSALHHVD